MDECIKYVAFIGTRDFGRLAPDRKHAYMEQAERYANAGYYLVTGGARGADLEAARVFLAMGCRVDLYIPWPGFNREEIDRLQPKPGIHVLDRNLDKRALDSVDKYHPFPSAITWGARLLHARNYLIVERAEVVIAVPSYRITEDTDIDKAPGGTLQGIRIAIDLGRELITL